MNSLADYSAAGILEAACTADMRNAARLRRRSSKRARRRHSADEVRSQPQSAPPRPRTSFEEARPARLSHN